MPYTALQLREMRDWIAKQKCLDTQINDNEFSFVSPNLLNSMQNFAYKLVELYKKNNQQLLLIVNGTAVLEKGFLFLPSPLS